MNNAKLDRQLVMSSEQWSNMSSAITTQWSGNVAYLESVSSHSSVVPDTWRGDRIALKEIEVVADGFADKNQIGSGNCGVVYRGVMLDATRVAVKTKNEMNFSFLFFRMPDKFLFRIYTKLLFISIFCSFLPSIRILVSEYVDNGNLHQWLYGFSEQVSPLTWAIRMNIIRGIAKG